MKVLIVGAGAVGQVFALSCLKAGAEVAWAVRSAHKIRPTPLHRLALLGGARRDVVAIEDIVSEPSERRFDVVVLTVPSDALKGQWLRSMAAVFENATVVALQPGLDDRARLLQLGISSSQLVRGLIGFISYATPLTPGDRIQDAGLAYWFPPVSPCAFDGPTERLELVLRMFRQGGLPAVRRSGLETELVFFTSGLLATIRALEKAHWSLAELARNPSLSVRASAEALAITSKKLGQPVPFGPSLSTNSWVVGVGSRLAPVFAPFEVEAYLRVHFTKVAAQTRLLLGELREAGRTFGLSVTALEELLAAEESGA